MSGFVTSAENNGRAFEEKPAQWHVVAENGDAMVGPKERRARSPVHGLTGRGTLVHGIRRLAEKLLENRVRLAALVAARDELTPLAAVLKRRAVRLPANP